MKYIKAVDNLVTRSEEFLSALAMLSMCLVVFAAVVCRYALALPFAAGEEIARYLMVWCIFLGIIGATRKSAHVGVEVFIGLLPTKPKRFFIFLSQLITMLCFCVLFYLAIMMIETSMGPRAQRTPLTRLPYWYMYMSLAIGFGLSAIRSLQLIVKEFFLKTKPESSGIESKMAGGNHSPWGPDGGFKPPQPMGHLSLL
jgi:C4-dicarboxylate transporter DctQ subunit